MDRELTPKNGKPGEPTSLLKVQIGPVQEFIAQARSTRDLWSGSYLLSWLVAQLIARMRSEFNGRIEFEIPFVPPDSTDDAFPPTLRWIEASPEERETLDIRRALMPAIPNVILAKIEGACEKSTVKKVIAGVFSMDDEESVWWRIADSCWCFFDKHGGGLASREGWDRQVGAFWQTAFQIKPWQENEDAILEYQDTPIGRIHDSATQGKPDPWMANYQVLTHRLDARRKTRNFDAWQGVEGRDQDALSGRGEALIDEAWREKLEEETGDPKLEAKRKTLRNLFRSTESLGAINLIKRVWHKAYLEQTEGFRKRGKSGPLGDTYFNIPSIPGVAAFPWVKKLALRENEPNGSSRISGAVADFRKSVRRMDQFRQMDFAKRGGTESEDAWFRRVDWEVFHQSFWAAEVRAAEESEEPNSPRAKTAADGLKALGKLIDAADIGRPARYWAVVAMDGDGMGRWMSGENFGGNLTLANHRDLSRGLCLATIGGSRVIAPLEIENARHDDEEPGASSPSGAIGIFENPWDPASKAQGKVIYAGADDVLAVLPAEQAIDSPLDMAKAFGREMTRAVKRDSDGPPFSISAGIAIGHIKEPLQDMIQTALTELKRAKRELGGAAMAVTLFKRSGEMVRWGAKYGSSAFDLLRAYRKGRANNGRATPDQRKPPISSRFPHRLAEVLRGYQNYTERDEMPDLDQPLPLTQEVLDAAKLEFAHLTRQQIHGRDDQGRETQIVREVRQELKRYAADYLAELLPQEGRPLADFIDLFQLEAFIARQED